MIIDETFKRQVRIIGKPGGLVGYMVTVQDAETGEPIEHVFRAVVTLDASELNVAELSYYETDKETGKMQDQPITKTITVEDPELDVTAYER